MRTLQPDHLSPPPPPPTPPPHPTRDTNVRCDAPGASFGRFLLRLFRWRCRIFPLRFFSAPHRHPSPLVVNLRPPLARGVVGCNHRCIGGELEWRPPLLCADLRPPRPCEPENPGKIRKAANERYRTVRRAPSMHRHAWAGVHRLVPSTSCPSAVLQPSLGMITSMRVAL